MSPASLDRADPPQFFVPGAQKSGTTSLFFYLKRHPRIVLGENKEVHFFDQHYARGIEWYRQQLPPLSRAQGALTGDFTPLYLFHPRAAERMAKHFPAARVIVLLRNPVDRAFSHFHHVVRQGLEPRSFATALREEPAIVERELERIAADEHYFSTELQRYSYLSRGHYAEQLERLFRSYPREQVLVLQSEPLFTDAQRVLERIYRFLGLESIPAGAFRVHNATEHPPLDAAARRDLGARFAAPNERLFELLGERYDWR